MPAELLLRSGHIFAADPVGAAASALAVESGRIRAIGGADLDALRGPDTRVVDLDGALVVPGFVDAHVHFGSFALSVQRVDLNTSATLEQGLADLRRAAEQRPSSGTVWLEGRGWDRNRWGRLPTARELDSAIGDRPAALSSHDGHSLWLSSAAMRIIGLDRSTQAPAGGVIERDEHGEPTGVLFENARDLVDEKIPEPTHAELREAIARALPIAAAAGITGIHNLEGASSFEAFRALESDGRLSLRVCHGIARSQLRHAKEQQLHTGQGSDWLRIGPVKLFSDGALGSRTAHMLEPYVGREHDGYRGVPTLTPEELREAMRLAADAGLDVAVHAIGDAAVRSVLDAVEAVRGAYPPFRERLVRIEHAQLVHPDDVARFAQLGVIASMQPIHAVADWRAADSHWGGRARHGYAWRDLLRAKATLAFGTDAPVERIEPLLSLSAATTREDPDGEPAGGWYPEQRLSLIEAITAYTLGSARAERAAHRRGALKSGYDADLVVLSPDPLPADAGTRQPPPAAHQHKNQASHGASHEMLKMVRVRLTVVGGRVVFEA